MTVMLNEIKSKQLNLNKEKYSFKSNGNNNGNGSSYDDDYYEHPSWEEIMAFVTATKDDIMNEPVNAFKMVMHFCQCEECRTVKNEMMMMEEKLNADLEAVRVK